MHPTHHRLRRLTVAAAGFAIATAGLTLAPAATATKAPPGSGTFGPTGHTATPASNKHTVTLITGDVVTVTDVGGGRSTIEVEPADPKGSGVRVVTEGKDTYVLPTSAMPYLAADRLDRDLFNVTQLIADGYDDAHRSTTPLIVQYAPSKARSGSAPAPRGSSRTRVLESIDGAALTAKKPQANVFWQSVTQQLGRSSGKARLAGGITKIWLDGKVKANLDQSVPQVHAPEAWAAGFQGEGTTVAVLDTGVDTEHPDLAEQVTATQSFVPGEDVSDFRGHGTHVSSTIAGTGAASDGRYKGVAPKANLIVGKVLGNDGFGQDSWIIDGMEWASRNAKVVNMSLGSQQPTDGTDPMAQSVNALSEETGALFVIAAGNSGTEQTISSPGSADAALTVGGVDKQDQLAWFTSQGPRIGDMAIKPDMVAPGDQITAARSHLMTQGSGYYVGMSGTSMATPHVAGAAAIVAQKHPDWTGAQIKNALMSTTDQLPDLGPYQVGTGRLNVAAALGDLRATGSAFFGFFDWPHEGDTPVDKVVTYTNSSDQPLELDLAPTFADADGTTPQGIISLSTQHLTVPANGSAEVTVTVDPNLAKPGSRFTGQLVARTDGKVAAHTALAMVKEDERYSLTLTATDRDGSPTLAYAVLTAPGVDPQAIAVDGERTLRLPSNTYSVMSFMDVDTNTDHAGVALVGDPEVTLDAPRTVALDARKARKITASVPKKDTEPLLRRMDFHRTLGDSEVTSSYLVPVWVDNLYAAPTTPVTQGSFEMLTRWRLAKPLLTITDRGRALDDIPQVGSALWEGRRNLKAVYAGQGTPADYDGLNAKGKAVVVRRSDAVDPHERAAAAVDSGARLVIVVNDQPTELSEYVGGPDGDVPITVASVTGKEGDRLIRAARSGNARLHVRGTPDSPFVYDLVDPHTGAIPKDLRYAPGRSDLARVDTRYASDRDADGAEFRYDMRPYTFGALGYMMRTSLPQQRVEWVSATKDTTWYQQARTLEPNWEVRNDAVSFEPGERVEHDWFSPVVRPRLGPGFWKPFRIGNDLQVNIPPFADSGEGHTGAMDFGVGTHLELYRDGVLAQEADSQALYLWDVPSEPTPYRVVLDATRDPDRFSTSTSTHTEWSFTSAETQEHTELPLLSLDYDVATDIHGDALAGRHTTLGLTAVPVEAAPGHGTVQGATLEVSFNDGKSWKKVRLHPDGEGWTATITNPRRGADFVSLRASAWDDAGNRIDQTVIRAYGLR